MNGIHVIVQARLSSKRLPNKVLKKIYKNNNSLSLIHSRLKKSKIINKIIFAIPKNSKNLKLKQFLIKKKYNYYEGPEKDVFMRYKLASDFFKSKIIVRITSDCPFVDSKIIEKLVSILIKKKYDYVSNTYPASFPDGLDVEVFTKKSIDEALTMNLNAYQKEHVTPIFKQVEKYNIYNLSNKNDFSNIRLTLDTTEDLIKIKKIFNAFPYSKLENWNKIEKLITDKKNNKIFNFQQHFSESIFNSSQMWKYAKKIIPDGNMLLSKRPNKIIENIWPNYFTKTKDAYVWGIDNKKYLDAYLMGVGTNTLGYSRKEVDSAVKNCIKLGNLSSLNCYEEVLLAEKLLELHKWSDMAKFTRSGGEANSVAIRIARSSTDRKKVAVCGYHGWHDWYLATNISDNRSLNNHLRDYLNPVGVPLELKNTSFSFEYNNFENFKNIIEKNNIGIVKMEVARFTKPKNNFLKKIRNYTKKHGIILIFDECTTGFRNNYGGLHLEYGIFPDLVIFGKALGNGYAINAILGSKEIMENSKKTFISSTFWTERIGPTAALKSLEVMNKIKSWKIIKKNGELIKKNWLKLSKSNNIKLDIYGLESILEFNIMNTNFDVKNYLIQHFLKSKILAANRVYTSVVHDDKTMDNYFNELDNAFRKISLNN